MEFLDKGLELLNSFESGPALMIAAMVVEVSLRAVKTEKPRSLLYVSSDLLKKSADLLSKLSELLDKVLQRTK